MKKHPVVLADDEHGVLIFHLWENKIPEGVQVQSASAAPAMPKVPAAEVTSEKVEHVRLSIDSFLERCSITTISVLRQSNGYCKVYVNFEVDPTRPGYNSWGNAKPYKDLVRGILFDQKYESAKINRAGKKVSVVFSDRRAKTATRMLTFVSPDGLARLVEEEKGVAQPKKIVMLVRKNPQPAASGNQVSGDDASTSALASALARAGVK